ncbi:CDGSH iron-sulfur domain-containing protein [Citricoccus nitrophenolicus]|uniref:CDGSH iron-sulfur domain-containing protein n=1 Tax=Citricoccus nitrophenolicus TaxID=863575 RepID=UPI0031E8EB7D
MGGVGVGGEGHLEHPDVILCPGGPLLLRGDHVVQDEEGTEHRTTRPVSAVCRCGSSAIKPWCDGTHKILQQREKRHQN